MSLIEVRGLKKSFGSINVLTGLDLTVEQGERVAVIGGSGCGKSVFLRSLCLLEKPDAGQVFIDGKEITAAKGGQVDEIRRSMGMVFQKFHLFSEMDVMDNLCLAPTRIMKMSRDAAEQKAMELLAQVGLASRAHAWPTVLSGGQQQRIAIARMFLKNPPIIFLDEPTASLDAIATEQIKNSIDEIKKNRTVIIISHNISQIIDSDVIYALAKGRVEQSGNPDEVYAQGGVYKDIVDASARSLNIEKLASTLDLNKDGKLFD
jgi:polar amino acid transport system ATP-binding protein